MLTNESIAADVDLLAEVLPHRGRAARRIRSGGTTRSELPIARAESLSLLALGRTR